MTCKIITDESGNVIGIACGSPWGIGEYWHCHDATCWCEGKSVYGFGQPANPEDFIPDADSCTAEELAAHAEALALWRAAACPPQR